MNPRFATKAEIYNWDNLIIKNPDGGNMFASYEFAMQKLSGGYKVHFIILENMVVTVLEKNIPFLGKLWYLPKGPEVTSVQDLLVFLENFKTFAKDNGVFAIRVESELPKSSQKTLEDNGLIKTKPIIPNSSTITLDLNCSVDKLLTNLPQKGRHAIRRAERDGVVVKKVKATEKNCNIMYTLLSETAKGQFGIRNYKYFKSFWQRFEKSKKGQLFFAYFDDQVVAGAYAVIMGHKSTYKDGASIRERVVYGASHLLQWHVIKWAKENGSKLHDLCGSPPSDEIKNSKHRHYGIGLFKTAFNKNVVDYIGCYDYIINPFKYKLWLSFAEKIAIRLYYYKHHDSYY
jgi:lipid II:glycine glycyltransferase (peptidoglycan interpeptide bridge formation enzyme)